MKMHSVNVIACLLLLLQCSCAERDPVKLVPPGFRYPELGETVVIENVILVRDVRGRVTDQTGAPVVKALVELTAPRQEVRLDARFTDRMGSFQFLVPKGRQYGLKVTKPGFAPLMVVISISDQGATGVSLVLNVAS